MPIPGDFFCFLVKRGQSQALPVLKKLADRKIPCPAADNGLRRFPPLILNSN